MFLPHAGTKTSSASSHKPAKAAAVSEFKMVQQLNDNVYNTHDAIGMVNRLLDSHPLSERPPAEVAFVSTPEGLPADCATASNNDSNGQHCTVLNASTHAQAPSQPAKWPTPKPSEWKDIELVASRACSSLKWVLSLDATIDNQFHDDLNELTRDLCQLIQRLVIGHLPDLDLDMQQLFKAGLQPVLAALLAGHAEYTALTVAMLSRLATDSTLISQSQLKDAVQLLSVFCGLCELQQAHPAVCHDLYVNHPVQSVCYSGHRSHHILSILNLGFKRNTAARGNFLMADLLLAAESKGLVC